MKLHDLTRKYHIVLNQIIGGDYHANVNRQRDIMGGSEV